MKRFFALILCMMLAVTLFGCGDGASEPDTEVVYVDDYVDRSELEKKYADCTESVKLWYYSAAGPVWDASLSDKLITGPYAGIILEELGRLSPDPSRYGADGSLTVKGGSMWVDTGKGDLYRLSHDGETVAKTTDFYTLGTVMQGGEGLYELIREIYSYHGENRYFATYNDGRMTVRQYYKTDTDVSVRIEDFHYRAIRDYKPESAAEDSTGVDCHTIDVVLTSRVDQEVGVTLNASTFDGCILTDRQGDYETVKLKAGVPKTVTLSFQYDASGYTASLSVSGNRISISVQNKTD